MGISGTGVQNTALIRMPSQHLRRRLYSVKPGGSVQVVAAALAMIWIVAIDGYQLKINSMSLLGPTAFEQPLTETVTSRSGKLLNSSCYKDKIRT